MGNLIFRKGIKVNLPSQLVEGHFYLVEDEKRLQINDCVFEDSTVIKNGVLSFLYEKVTYTQLKERRDNNLLTPNACYCIIDYNASTLQAKTRAVTNTLFYICVQAIASNKLSEEAFALPLDSAASQSSTPFNAWEIKYSLDNDTSRFAWANSVNGKGVIYYMKDNYNNIAWYDFKNIQFLRDAEWLSTNSWWNIYDLSGAQYFFTFSRIENGTIVDDSLGTGKYPCTDNHLGHSTALIPSLNNTIFIGNGNYNNKLGDGHSNNTFGKNTWNNVIGMNFKNNVIYESFQSNIIGNQFENNTIKYYFTNNNIGPKCSTNTFHKTFKMSSIGVNAYSNNFSIISDTIIGNNFHYNNFLIADNAEGVNSCKFGNNIQWVSDIPSTLKLVSFEDNSLQGNSSNAIYLNNLSTFLNKKVIDIITNVSNTEELIVYKSEFGYDVDKKSDIKKLLNYIHDLGDFTRSGDAESLATNPNISTDKTKTLLKYTVSSDNKIGFIEQYVDLGNLTTRQVITWDGIQKQRILTFIKLGNSYSLTNSPSWEEITSLTVAEKNTFNNYAAIIAENEEVTSTALLSLHDNIQSATTLFTNTTQELKDNLIETQAIVTQISGSFYYAGDFSDWGSMLRTVGNPLVSGNQSIEKIYFTFKNWNKSGVIEQQVSDTKTLQTLKWDNCETLRYIIFADGNRTSTNNSGDDFKHIRTMPTELYYKPSEKKLSFRQKGYNNTYIQGLDNHADFGTITLPSANAETYSVVKLDNDYTKTTSETALSLQGANNMYQTLNDTISANTTDVLNSLTKVENRVKENEKVTSVALNKLNTKSNLFQTETENTLSSFTETITTISGKVETSKQEIIDLTAKTNNISGATDVLQSNVNTVSGVTELLHSEINTVSGITNTINTTLTQHIDLHDNISLKADTNNRDNNTAPSHYLQKFKVSGIKLNNAIGINSNYGLYSALLGIHPWHEQSGIHSHELAFTQYGKLLHRSGANGWGNWYKVIESDDIASTSTAGIVKINSAYTNSSTDTALSLQGANDMYQTLNDTISANTTDINDKIDTIENIVYENEEVIANALVQLNDKIVPLMVDITYEDLIQLRNTNQLIRGQKYRIIDYVTTTITEQTRSVGNQFDIIVEALSGNLLNENAQACLHDGDTYFSSFNTKFESWALSYCIDNDTTRFKWADANNGKGVIYYMKDEYNNECFYDFKNIQYWQETIDDNITCNASSKWFYTFTIITSDGEIEDASVQQEFMVTHSNHLGAFTRTNTKTQQFALFRVMFINSVVDEGLEDCFGNVIQEKCGNIVFGNGCSNNHIGCYSSEISLGDYCFNNVIHNSLLEIKMGRNCVNNVIHNGSKKITIGDNCENNYFGYMSIENKIGVNSYNNIFQNNCGYNVLGDNCKFNFIGQNGNFNKFGNYCQYNTLNDRCKYITLGNNYHSNTFGKKCLNIAFVDGYAQSYDSNLKIYVYDDGIIDNVMNVCVGDGCEHLLLIDNSTHSSDAKIQNIKVAQGLRSIDYDEENNCSKLEPIEINVAEQNYILSIARKTTNEIVVYCEADLFK